MATDTCVSEVPTFAPAPLPVGKTAPVDLATIPWDIPWALLTEHEAAAVLHQSVKVLRRQRHEGVGPLFLKLNGCTVRYKLADLQAFLGAQPTGGGCTAAASTQHRRRPGRPRKTAA